MVRIAAVQTEYSVLGRDIEGAAGTDLLATARELGVAVVVATPLGRGLLTTTFSSGEALGDSKDMRPVVMPRFREENRARNVEVVSQFRALAEKKGYTVSPAGPRLAAQAGPRHLPHPRH